MDISTKPLHHAKLLEVISKIYDAYKKYKNIKFYVTGGAASAYLLPEEGLPINDIDCVCVINTDLPPEKYKATQKYAIKTAMEITRSVLDSVTAEELGDEIKGGPLAITKLPYMMNASFPENYRFPITESSESSPFTGKIYEDSRVGIIVLSVTQRTAERLKLMDIAFPLLSYDKANYYTKWSAPTQLVEVLGYSIPILTPYSLRANQQYAANHTPNTNTTGAKERRLNRVRRLTETYSLLPVITAVFAPESARPAPIVRPANAPIAATGGAGTASSGREVVAKAATGGAGTTTSPPPPQLSIYEFNGKVFLADHSINRFWPAQGYDPATGIYSFITGFSGKIGNYWLYPDNFYRMYPPGM